MDRLTKPRTLGLKSKGHLGIGADADIAVYNIDPKKSDPSRKYKRVRRAFERAAYTIKGGKIASKNGEIIESIPGKTFWVDVKTREPMKVNADFKKRFSDYWTVQYDNYMIPERYLHASAPIPINAEV